MHAHASEASAAPSGGCKSAAIVTMLVCFAAVAGITFYGFANNAAQQEALTSLNSTLAYVVEFPSAVTQEAAEALAASAAYGVAVQEAVEQFACNEHGQP